MVIKKKIAYNLGKSCLFQQSAVYLIRSALNSDRLSLLALGSKHFLGADDIPQDHDQSFYYYIQIAKIAKDEYYNPIPDENYPYFVRISDKSEMDTLTNENGGDLFEWLKDQAKKGVVSAQVGSSSMFPQMLKFLY